MDLLKVCDYIFYGLLITKLCAFGFTLTIASSNSVSYFPQKLIHMPDKFRLA